MLPALRWGALVGVAAYLIAGLAIPFAGLALFGNADLSNPGVLIFGCSGIFLLLFGFSAAGYFTGRDTLKAGLGAVSGLAALAVYAVLTALYSPRAAGGTTTTPASANVSAIGQAIASIVAAVFVFAIAALMGWLGGRPGAQKALKRQAAQAQAAAATATPTDAR